MRALAALLAAALVAGAGAAAASSTADVDPTAKDLAESVHVIDPSDSVQAVELDDSVVPLEVREQAGSRTTVTVSSDVLFEFGSAAVAGDVVDRLTSLAGEVPDGAAVTVIGHTDDIGDDAANDALSRQRAEAVAVVLRAADPSLQITADGRGEREPVQPNSSGGEDDPSGRAANRRVEISFAAG